MPLEDEKTPTFKLRSDLKYSVLNKVREKVTSGLYRIVNRHLGSMISDRFTMTREMTEESAFNILHEKG